MPQLDLATFPPQLIWLAITFVALYLVMAYAGLPRLGGIIERRRARIEGDLDKAQRMKAEAEAVIAAYEKALAEARDEGAGGAARDRQPVERRGGGAAKEARRAACRSRAPPPRSASRPPRPRRYPDCAKLAVDVARAASAKLSGREAEAAHVAEAVDAVLKERA